MADAPGTIVCILGMHRSGTSCLAGCLEERGLHLGEVVNSAPHNPKGNKEHPALRAINDDVLAFSGGSWDRPPRRLRWSDGLRARRDEHLASRSSQGAWGFKDPRTILTLPFWREAVSGMRLVGTFRHPEGVVQSLLRRPGLTPASDPLDLWMHYNAKLLACAEQHHIPLVCFDWPAPTYVRALEQVVRHLGLRGSPTASFQFFDDGLRHGRPTVGSATALGRDARRLLEALHEHCVDPDVPARVPSVRADR